MLVIFIVFLIAPKRQTTLLGFYQSDGPINGYHIQLSIWQRKNSFSLYIDNRELVSGVYKQLDDNTYELLGDNQTFIIELNRQNSFEIIISKLNDGKPIRMNNIGYVPMSFSGDFADVDKYNDLLE